MNMNLFSRRNFISGNAWRVLISFITAFSMSVALADSSVWQVKSDNSTLFIGGTVHLLRPSDYPLPVEYEEAYAESQQLYFETDISSMNDLSVQAKMLQELTYNDARTLNSVLSEEAYSALSEYTERVGMPLMMMEKFKPGMVVSTLQILEFQKLGFTPQGVDAHFNARGVSDGKSIGALETIEEQIGFLAAMGEGNESEFIMLSLQDLEKTNEIMGDMISAWREGDSEVLEQLFVTDMKEQAPDIYDSLLRQRNLRWIPQIVEMLNDSDTEFVLVGAAHLISEDGLVELLQARGYEVTQL